MRTIEITITGDDGTEIGITGRYEPPVPGSLRGRMEESYPWTPAVAEVVSSDRELTHSEIERAEREIIEAASEQEVPV